MNYFPPKPLFSVRSLRQKHISTPIYGQMHLYT